MTVPAGTAPDDTGPAGIVPGWTSAESRPIPPALPARAPATTRARPGHASMEAVTAEDCAPGIDSWLASRIPGHWPAQRLEVSGDQDELLIVVDLDDPDADEPAIEAFREGSRDDRVAIARDAERAFAKKISWGVRVKGRVLLFTTISVPVMTRLRLSERQVLDTLIDAGVARTRSEALAWCVRLVGDNERAWIDELQEAFAEVRTVRDRGPRSRRKD